MDEEERKDLFRTLKLLLIFLEVSPQELELLWGLHMCYICTGDCTYVFSVQSPWQ